jgi:hypothetical protein
MDDAFSISSRGGTIALLGGKFKIFGAEVSETAGRGPGSFAAVAGSVLIMVGLFFALRPPGVRPLVWQAAEKVANVFPAAAA